MKHEFTPKGISEITATTTYHYRNIFVKEPAKIEN